MIRSNPGASVYQMQKIMHTREGDRSWYETEGKGKRKEREGFEEGGGGSNEGGGR